jgi:hypothetical protein
MISLHRRDGLMGKGPYQMEVKRRKVYIDPENTSVMELDLETEYEDIPYPGERPVTLEVTLGMEGIDAIRCNAQLLPRLTAPHVNAWFAAADYRGPAGLFNYGHRGTTFSNIEFSPLESLKKE